MTIARPNSTDRLLKRGSIALLACLAAVLVSCDKQPAPADPTTVDRVGIVLLSQTSEAGAPAGQATFVELGAARAQELMENPFGEQVGTCRVSVAGAASDGAIVPAPGGQRLNAGSVVLRADNAPYGTLVRGQDDRYGFQATPDPLPASMSLRVQGTRAFPGFGDVAVSTGAAPELSSAFDTGNVTASTQFAWTPGAAGAVVLLVGSDGDVTFACVADDAAGTFKFPEVARDELTGAGFDGGTLDVIGRITTTKARSGSALLLVGALRLAYVGADQ